MRLALFRSKRGTASPCASIATSWPAGSITTAPFVTAAGLPHFPIDAGFVAASLTHNGDNYRDRRIHDADDDLYAYGKLGLI